MVMDLHVIWMMQPGRQGDGLTQARNRKREEPGDIKLVHLRRYLIIMTWTGLEWWVGATGSVSHCLMNVYVYLELLLLFDWLTDCLTGWMSQIVVINLSNPLTSARAAPIWTLVGCWTELHINRITTISRFCTRPWPMVVKCISKSRGGRGKSSAYLSVPCRKMTLPAPGEFNWHWTEDRITKEWLEIIIEWIVGFGSNQKLSRDQRMGF